MSRRTPILYAAEYAHSRREVSCSAQKEVSIKWLISINIKETDDFKYI